ncbi:MAG: sulfur carrier protein ThiS [Acidimicrobiales bacterium]
MTDVVVTVNGEKRPVPSGTTVADMVAITAPSRGGSDRGIAVAVNREVIPRGTWGSVRLTGGETVEIVTAVAGGC